MTVESNYAIPIATLSDLLKTNLAPVFQRTRSSTKTNSTLYARFFSLFGQVTVHCIARNSDWFITLFASVVIGQSNYFWFFDSRLKTALTERINGFR